jgi:hypothetical protein
MILVLSLCFSSRYHLQLKGNIETYEINISMYVLICMYKGWAFIALAPRPTVVYCALCSHIDSCSVN